MAENENLTCPAVGYQRVSVSVPVTVTPFSEAGTTVTTCCGNPVITVGAEDPPAGVKNGNCVFVISQTMCVEVPVEFGATASVGSNYVECLGASATDTCTDCTAEPENNN